MQLLHEGDTWDSAAWNDWIKSVYAILDNQNNEQTLTNIEAFKAMVKFLELYYNMTYWVGIKSLLHELQFNSHPDVLENWIKCINEALNKEKSKLA